MPKKRSFAPFRFAWLALVLVAFFPFLMRTGLDFEKIEKTALLNLYRHWHWSEGAHALKKHKVISFEGEDQNFYSDLFKAQLQQDFVVDEFNSGVPRVKVFFESSKKLNLRLELDHRSADLSENVLWEDSIRFVNNGIMLGPWLGVLSYVLGSPLYVSASLSIGAMLMWHSDWSLLNVHQHIYREFSFLSRQAYYRVQNLDFKFIDAQFLALLFSLLMAPLLFFFFSFFKKKSFFLTHSTTALLFLSFLVEPIALFLSSKFALWPEDAYWWMVYLGAFQYRYITIAFIFLFLWSKFCNPQEKNEKLPDTVLIEKAFILVFCLPLVFNLVQGWSWVNVTFTSTPTELLLRLKAFMLGLLLAFSLGSRLYSLLFAILAYTVISPPTMGHAQAAGHYASLMDGLLLGWWATPFKALWPVMPLGIKGKSFLWVASLGWLFGSFLPSVGVSPWVCAPIFFFSIWFLLHENKESQLKVSFITR